MIKIEILEMALEATAVEPTDGDEREGEPHPPSRYPLGHRRPTRSQAHKIALARTPRSLALSLVPSHLPTHAHARTTAISADYDEQVLPVLEEQSCCFIMYRLDTKSSNGYNWVFISYSPGNVLHPRWRQF